MGTESLATAGATGVILNAPLRRQDRPN